VRVCSCVCGGGRPGLVHSHTRTSWVWGCAGSGSVEVSEASEVALPLLLNDKVAVEGTFSAAFGLVFYGEPTTADPCACSPIGLSGEASVEFKGCANHPGQSWSSNGKLWCFVNGGSRCNKATSMATGTAAWRYCADTEMRALRNILFRFSPTSNLSVTRNDADATLPCGGAGASALTRCDLNPWSFVEYKWGREATAGGLPLQPGVRFSIVIQKSAAGFEVTIDGLRTPEFDFTQRIAGNVTAVELQSVGSSGLSLYSTVALKSTRAPTNAAFATIRGVTPTTTLQPRRFLPLPPHTSTDPRPRNDADDAAGITLAPDEAGGGHAINRAASRVPPPPQRVTQRPLVG
jgi:hypothetical protein